MKIYYDTSSTNRLPQRHYHYKTLPPLCIAQPAQHVATPLVMSLKKIGEVRWLMQTC